MNDRSNVSVLVPAAGRGMRLGGERKQFRLLGGASILVRTLEVFERHPLIASLIVAAPPGEVAGLADTLRQEGIHKLLDVVPGGATRQDSVAAALAVVPEDVSIVLVHDSVRPLLPSDCVTAIVEVVDEHGAAALALPLADTVRKGEHDVFGPTVPRSGLYRMQTPQGFRRDWFDEAHRAARDGGYSATDDVDLVQRIGRSVRIVHGAATNLKITTPSDWDLAEALWARRHAPAS